MRNMGIVQGSKELAHTPFEICVDTVYLRFNPTLVPQNGEAESAELWQYYEIQYSLREWLQVVTEATIDTNSFVLDTRLAKRLTAVVEVPYAGLPEQKPFNFNMRLAQSEAATIKS